VGFGPLGVFFIFDLFRETIAKLATREHKELKEPKAKIIFVIFAFFSASRDFCNRLSDFGFRIYFFTDVVCLEDASNIALWLGAVPGLREALVSQFFYKSFKAV
jgi:hypothetical protein